MRKLICLLILLITAGPAMAWTGSWESIRQATEKIESITADFRQEKQLPILKHPLISEGKIYYAKPDSLRWEYEKPVVSILMIYQGKVRRFLKRDGKFVPDVGAEVQVLQMVLSEITRWLGGHFQEGKNFTATLDKGGIVRLVPVNKQMSKMISRIDLVFSKQPGVINSVTIFENRDSFTRLIFSHVKLNETIPPAIFERP